MKRLNNICFGVALFFLLYQIAYADTPVQASSTVSPVEIKITGEYRLRGETRDGFGFSSLIPDTTNFYLQRIRIGIEAKVNDNIKIFTQLQDSRVWGLDPVLTSTGVSTLDIHQAYVSYKNPGVFPVSFKIGRQEMSYGDQRLIGAFNWSNQGRAFDAVKVIYNNDMANIDAWSAKVSETSVNPALVAQNKSTDTDFYGLYSTVKTVIPIDLYALYKNDMTANKNTTTIGSRINGKSGSFDYGAEGALQTGSAALKSVQANAYAIKAGYTFIPDMMTRIGIEYDHGSGGGNANTINTFDNLYPTNHPHYGLMDYFSWQNMQDIKVSLSSKIASNISIGLDYNILSLADPTDAWYGANGAARAGFGANPANTLTNVGQEIDLAAKYNIDTNMTLEAGYGIFIAGDYIRSVRGTNTTDSHWGYIQMSTTF